MTDGNGHVADRVAELIARLDSLLHGEEAAARLVACGREAIEPLRRFLLESPIRSVASPRCWAVQALAGLGAKDVLLEYLSRDATTHDPALRLAEEAVQRAAALAVTEWRTDDVFDALLMLTMRRPIAGVLEALGRFEKRDAVPVLLHALEDDCCRPFAEAALARTADRDRDLLIRSALVQRPAPTEESESSLRRRRASLALMRDVRLSADACDRIAALVDAADIELAVAAAALCVKWGAPAIREHAQQRLWQLVPTVPWHLHYDIRQLLLRR